jgi:hypothetical protein
LDSDLVERKLTKKKVIIDQTVVPLRTVKSLIFDYFLAVCNNRWKEHKVWLMEAQKAIKGAAKALET